MILSGADVVRYLDESLSNGMQVPIILGVPPKDTQAHYVLVQARVVLGSIAAYSVHDPGDGVTKIILANDIANRTIPGGYNLVGTIEVPVATPTNP
jgi:hypothetical protein